MNALAGVRVLDLGTGIASPIVGMFLGDFGADVIKVEHPGGEWGRRLAGFAVRNRNKRGVVLDPALMADQAWLRTSLTGADVCILGPDERLEDWGMDIDEAVTANPGLIIVRLPAYVDGYQPWSGRGESNGLLSAFGGQAWRQSSFSGGPIESVAPMMSYAHGTWAAACTVAALVERTVSGRGQVVTVSGMNGLAQAAVANLTVEPEKANPPTDIGPAGRHPTYRQFQCANDEWVTVGALGPKFSLGIVRLLGAHEILDDPRIGGDAMKMILPENLSWCLPILQEKFLQRDRDAVLTEIRALGIPAGAIWAQEDWMDFEQIRAIGMRAELDDPERGHIVMPGIPINLTLTPGLVRLPAPRLGEHNGVEPWRAHAPTSQANPRYVPGPLTGFRFINMGTFVASPYAGFLLAELGADVVKVEPLTGDPYRASGYTFNRGMRSLAVDLKCQTGQDVLHRLVAESDAILDGMRPGVMRRLNADYKTLRSFNPTIIALSLSGYGENGPWADEPGVDMVIQGQCGMSTAQGTPTQPFPNTIAVADVTTASMSVLATCIALYHRQMTGQGQRIWDSLAATATFLQMDDLVRYEKRPPVSAGGIDFRGKSVLHSYHPVADGWIYIDVDDDVHFEDVVGVLRKHGLIPPLTQGSQESAAETFVAALARISADEALKCLRAAGIRSTKARQSREVLTDPVLLEHEVFHIRKADRGSAFILPGRYAAFSRTGRRGPLRPPGIGEHSRSVLEQIGFDKESAGRLIDEGFVRTGGRMSDELTTVYR